MNPLILMGIIVAVPTLLIVLARVKAALVFMALCVGSVLATYVGDAALDMVQTFVRGYNANTQAGVQLGLLLFPALLTTLFLSRTVSGAKWIMNLFPALLTGIMALYLVVPLLPEATTKSMYATSAWDQLSQYQAILIGVAVLFSLAQLWSGGHSARHKKKDKHK